MSAFETTPKWAYFSSNIFVYRGLTLGLRDNVEKAKKTSKVLYELTESYIELHKAIKGTARETAKTKKLWREGNKSNLIKIGMACIMFPDPSPVGEIIGAGFLVAGAVQKGIQKRTLYISDLKKNLNSTLRELNSTQCNLKT